MKTWNVVHKVLYTMALLSLSLVSGPAIAAPVLPNPRVVEEDSDYNVYLPTILRYPDSMVFVPAGQFQMGCDPSNPNESCYPDESPLHAVYLDAHWIDQHEVTNAQFQQFVDDTGHVTRPEILMRGWQWTPTGINFMWSFFWFQPRGIDTSVEGLEHPVILVTWDDASAYCAWADKRLPSEAEWKLAAQGTEGRDYPWGDTEPTGEYLNYCDTNCPFGQRGSGDEGFVRTAPVCQFPKGNSPYGLCDMGGNVWEWVADWAVEGTKRVILGGAWSHPASDAGVSGGTGYWYNGAMDVLGFRCARDADLSVVKRGTVWTRLGEP